MLLFRLCFASRLSYWHRLPCLCHRLCATWRHVNQLTNRALFPMSLMKYCLRSFSARSVLYRSNEASRHDHCSYVREISLCCAAQWACHPLRYRRWSRRLSMAGPAAHHTKAGMARLDSAAGNDRAPALSTPLYGRRTRQSYGCACALSWYYCLSYPRHQSATDHRKCGFVRMLSPGKWRRHRSLRSNSCRDQGYRPTEAGIVIMLFRPPTALMSFDVSRRR